MNSLTILEHASASYAPRTAVNATSADATLAFAEDFSSAGERLTKRVAGTRYLAVPLSREPGSTLREARRVFCFLRQGNSREINIAGNSMATLAEHGWSQHAVNAFVWQVLSLVHAHWPLVTIRSGGQTGADIAGAIAGVALGVPTTVLLPKGLLQRTEEGADVRRSRDFVQRQILGGSEYLLGDQQR